MSSLIKPKSETVPNWPLITQSFKSILVVIITSAPFLSFKDNNSPPDNFGESEVCKSSGIVSENTSNAFRVISK